MFHVKIVLPSAFYVSSQRIGGRATGEEDSAISRIGRLLGARGEDTTITTQQNRGAGVGCDRDPHSPPRRLRRRCKRNAGDTKAPLKPLAALKSRVANLAMLVSRLLVGFAARGTERGEGATGDVKTGETMVRSEEKKKYDQTGEQRDVASKAPSAGDGGAGSGVY